MKKRNNYFIGLVFLVITLGSPVFIFAAEEASTMMCDEGVVNIGDAMWMFRKNAASPIVKE